jgi:transglutaminase-like putative cysteine protease
MLHKGSYEFDYGTHLEMTLNGTSGVFSGLSSNETIETEEITEETNEINSNPSNEIFNSLENNISINKFYYLASNITRNSYSDYSKAKRIYQWVSKNISYDRSKYMRILNNDFSDKYGAEVALETGTGVCYDYAALVVELAKSVGLKAKLVKGDYVLSNGTAIYHAWNEIYLSELDKWIKLDTSSASVYGRNYFNSQVFDNNYFKTEEE